MAEDSESLKEEMSELLRGDLERARQKRGTDPEPRPAERKPGFAARFRKKKVPGT